MIGADGDHIPEVEPVQRTDEGSTLAVEAVSQHHTEVEPQAQEVLNECDSELGVGLVDIAWFEPRLGLVDPEEEGEGRRPQQAMGIVSIDRDDAVGQGMQVANVLGGDARRWCGLSCDRRSRHSKSMHRMNGVSPSAWRNSFRRVVSKWRTFLHSERYCSQYWSQPRVL